VVQLLATADVEHASAQTPDVVGDPGLLAGEWLPVDEPEPEATAGAVRTRVADRIGENPPHAVLEVVEHARRGAVDEEMAPSRLDARDFGGREVGRVGLVERETTLLGEPEPSHRIRAAVLVGGARAGLRRPRNDGGGANE